MKDIPASIRSEIFHFVIVTVLSTHPEALVCTDISAVREPSDNFRRVSFIDPSPVMSGKCLFHIN